MTSTIYNGCDKENQLLFADEYLYPQLKDNMFMIFKELGPLFYYTRFQMDNTRLTETILEGAEIATGDSQGDDVGGVMKVVGPKTVMDPRVDISLMGSSENSIKSFIQRPTIALTGVFSTTDGPATFPMKGLFGGLDSAMRNAKMAGVFAIRATTVLTLEANGTPFQSGLIIMASLPTGGADATNVLVSQRANSHRFSKTQITQLNHVVFDINTDKVAQLRVPYFAGVNACNIAINSANEFKQGSPGYWFLYPYVPLDQVGGASTTVPYTVWVHYEDVELFGNSIFQSAPSGRKNARKGKDVISAEQNADGPISKVLSVVSDISSALAPIPLLSGVAGPVAWAARAAANAAQFLGWSKPLLISDAVRIFQSDTPYLSVYDAKSFAEPLSLSIDNHVEIVPGFGGTDQDELSINFIKGIPSYFGQFTWPFTATQGTLLYDEFTDPSKYYIASVDGFTAVTSYTPIGYLGQIFEYWQGSIIINFKFSKTMFHAGRLAFCYTLKDPALTTPVINLGGFIYTHREIMDLTKGTEFSFEVPYIANTPWSYCAATTDAGQLSSGLWGLMVIDPLTYTTTVPNAITCVMEVLGGPSLNFSVPRAILGVPASILNYQSNGPVEGETYATLQKLPVGLSIASDHLGDAALCMGEAVTTLRAVLKRGGYCYNSNTTMAAAGASFGPHIINFAKQAVATNPVGVTNIDPYNIIACCYCLGRGGFRTAIISTTGTTSTSFLVTFGNSSGVTTFTRPYDATVLSVSNTILKTSGAAMTILNNTRSGTMVQTPQYLTGIARNLFECTVSGTNGVTANPSSPMVDKYWLHYRGTGTPSVSYFYRAISDDHTLGGFVSVPPFTAVLP